ncbi:hypothetical protein FBY13_102224 [Pantoea sp. SJZ147]|nr:hypothetical protein FBY13_102224 [Pantoea sp. SJZ147]
MARPAAENGRLRVETASRQHLAEHPVGTGSRIRLMHQRQTPADIIPRFLIGLSRRQRFSLDEKKEARPAAHLHVISRHNTTAIRRILHPTFRHPLAL